MAISAVILDLDDTLVVEGPTVEAVYLATCEIVTERYGVDPKALTCSIRRAARELWRASQTIAYCQAVGINSWEGLWTRFEGDDPYLMALREWRPRYRREAWARSLRDHGVKDALFAEELAALLERERRSRHIVFPDVKSALIDLRLAYRLAVLTNGSPDIQRERIEAAGLAGYFDEIVVSGEVGIGKPDPRIFWLAVERLGVQRGVVAMVGDSLDRDVDGAQRAGPRGIWLNRSRRKREEGIVPDFEIGELGELGRVLGLEA